MRNGITDDIVTRLPDWQVDAKLADEARRLRREIRYWKTLTALAMFMFGCAVGLLLVLVGTRIYERM